MESSTPLVLLVGPRPDPPYRGGVEKGVDLLLHTNLARQTRMRVFNNYRPLDPSRPIWEKIVYQAGKLLSFLRELRHSPVVLVHVKTSSGVNFYQNSLYVLLARLRGLPVVLQIHTGRLKTFYENNGPLNRAWVRRTLTAASRVATLSQSWAEYVHSIAPRARVAVIPNGLDVSELSTLREPGERRRNQVLFLGAGRQDLDRDKGLEDLLPVLPAVARRHPESRWVLAGLADPADVRLRLEREGLTETGLAGRVSCMGVVFGEEKQILLKQSSILVMPSYIDNFPNLLLEAMATGMAAVTSDLGAMPDMLGHGEGGLQVPTSDRAGLFSALDTLLSSPARVEAMGNRNQEVVSREYTLDVVQRKLKVLYREAAGLSASIL